MIQIVFGILFALSSATWDYGKRFKAHASRFYFRIFVVASLALFGGFTIREYLHNVYVITTTFYLSFDYLLNLFEKRKWNYIGSTSEIDKFTKEHLGWKTSLFVKIILFLIGFLW